MGVEVGQKASNAEELKRVKEVSRRLQAENDQLRAQIAALTAEAQAKAPEDPSTDSPEPIRHLTSGSWRDRYQTAEQNLGVLFNSEVANCKELDTKLKTLQAQIGNPSEQFHLVQVLWAYATELDRDGAANFERLIRKMNTLHSLNNLTILIKQLAAINQNRMTAYDLLTHALGFSNDPGMLCDTILRSLQSSKAEVPTKWLNKLKPWIDQQADTDENIPKELPTVKQRLDFCAKYRTSGLSREDFLKSQNTSGVDLAALRKKLGRAEHLWEVFEAKRDSLPPDIADLIKPKT